MAILSSGLKLAFTAALCAHFLAISNCETSTEAHTEGGGEEGVDVLAFFVIVLVIGVATYHVLAVTKIPYTALLIAWGVVLGVANETYDLHWKLIGPGTQAWQGINPTVLLTTFLPVLLFAAAFGLEWQYIRRLMGSGLLLAGPGVLFGASVTAVLVKFTFPYNWTWVQCLLFGAIFSATDPVAVVAVLKETGMPKKVRTLVDLEALLNDGTAYVLFVLLTTWAEGQHQSVGDSFRLFFRLTAGGPAVGVAFGLALTLWLRFMYNKPIAEITLTIAAAYGTYIVAEQLLGVSSVLAVVFLGLWMAAKGFYHISRKVEHPLHVIWEELEFVANTLVFVLSGIVIAGRIYESSNSDDRLIEASDWGYAMLLWVYLTVIRIAMFILAWPLLNQWGYVITPKEAVVLCWSGLRGAVGLALALFVLLDGEIADRRYRTLTFFFMGCVAFLTIIIQGTSMKPLLQSMKLTRPASVKRSFLSHVLKQVEEVGEEKLRLAKSDRILGEPDWQMLQRMADLEPQSMMRRYSSKLGSASTANINDHVARLALKLNRTLLVAEKRSRLLQAVRQTYNDFFQDHYVGTGQVFQLRLSVDEALDHLDDRLSDWTRLKSACHVPAVVAYIQRWARGSDISSRAVRFVLAKHLEDAAILALAFCHAHQLAVQDLVQYEKLEEWTEGDGSVQHLGLPIYDVLGLMRRNVSEQVMLESKAQVEQAYKFIADLRDAFPEVMKGLKTAQLAQEVLVYKEEYLNEIGRTGLIEESELESMLDLVEFKLSSLHFSPPRFPWPSPYQMLSEHPLFTDLDHVTFKDEVFQNVKIRFLNDLSIIHRVGEPVAYATVLLRGKARLEVCARESLSDSPRVGMEFDVAQAGSVLGIWPLLLRRACPFSTLTASACLVAHIPQNLLQRLVAKHKAVNEAALLFAGAEATFLHSSQPFSDYSFCILLKIFRHGRVECKDTEQQLTVASSALLLMGRLRLLQKNNEHLEFQPVLEGHCILPPEPAVYMCLTPCKVIHLPASLDLAAPKTEERLNKSALAEFGQPYGRLSLNMTSLSRKSAPQPPTSLTTTAAPSASHAGRTKPQASPFLATENLSETEVSLSQNRRKSLAHGLLIHSLATKQSGPTSPVCETPDQRSSGLNTLSGATGAMLLQEYRKMRQSAPQLEELETQPSDSAIGAIAEPSAADGNRSNALLAKKSAPASVAPRARRG